jgi:hypothetical protein
MRWLRLVFRPRRSWHHQRMVLSCRRYCFYVRIWVKEIACFNLRFDVRPIDGFLAMEVRMMERTCENLADGEGGQHQSSI